MTSLTLRPPRRARARFALLAACFWIGLDPLAAQDRKGAPPEDRGKATEKAPVPPPANLKELQKVMPDRVVMTADIYRLPDALDEQGKVIQDTRPVLILMHMTRSSRGEWRPLIPKIQEMGFHVVAPDIRQGGAGEFGDRKTGERSGTPNGTWMSAKEILGHSPDNLEAYADVPFVVAWTHELFPRSRVGLVGSSYTATYALVFGAEHPEAVDAVLAFSPGEYVPQWKVAGMIEDLAVPTYITCGNTTADTDHAKPLAAAIVNKSILRTFWPEDEKVSGAHGSWAFIVKDAPGRERQWLEFSKAVEPLRKPWDPKEVRSKRKAKPK